VNKFSPTLALSGIAALLVAVWGLIGSPDITNSGTALWSALAVAVLVGLALIFSGGQQAERGKQTQDDTESVE
jgi:peptidoglycan/LPS O-acetylase OafA/YrhL